MSIFNRVNRLFDMNDGFNTTKQIAQDKINNYYGGNQNTETASQDVQKPDNQYKGRAEQAVKRMNDTKAYNPFIRKDGTLVNPFADYSVPLNNPNINNQVKKWITEATGLKPNTVSDTETTAETASDNSFSGFNGNYSNDQLKSLDVATELPKLSAGQISKIISQHFSKSPVIKPSDADGIFNAQQSTGMSALAILGIGALESGYGTSNIAKQKNNLWGYGAINSNPGGAAHSFAPVAQGAEQFASKFMKTYYNDYGAKSIYSAGTGNNPSGKGYAYNNNGTINPQWATSVGDIMGRFYDTAKTVGGNVGGSNKLVNTAKQYLGTPYVWGGTSTKGFDCSGLMQYVAKQNGINLSRTTYTQIKEGTPVDKSNLREGDLVFFGTQSNPHHVGMYIGNGQYLHAPKTGDVVKISNLNSRNDYLTARRIMN